MIGDRANRGRPVRTLSRWQHMTEGLRPDDVLGAGLPEWPAVLERLCAVLPGSCVIHHLDAARRSSFSHACAAEAAALERWTQHVMRSDSTRAALQAGETVKVALGSAAHRVHALAAALRHEAGLVNLVHFRRPGPYGDGDGGIFERLVPLLRRAWSVEEEVARLRAERDRAQRTMDLAPLSLIVVDSAMRLYFANSMARDAMSATPPALRLSSGQVSAAQPGDAQRLRNAVKAVIAGRAPSLAVMVGRGLQRQPLAVTIRRVPDDPGAALLLVTDPEAASVSSEVLAALFSLTAAEARLARALMEGQTVDGAAAEFGVSVHTVRSQLRRLFQKTQTSRQSDLVRRLLGATRGL